MRHSSSSISLLVTPTSSTAAAAAAASPPAATAGAGDIMPPLSSSVSSNKPRRLSNSTSNHHSSSSPLFFCRHSPTATATLDLLILILVLFSGTFLVTSYFSYIFHSLSLLLPPLLLSHSSALQDSPLLYLLGFAVVFAAAVVALEICICGGAGGGGFGFIRSRRCDNPKCKGLKKAMEFDLQLQSEESLRSGPTTEIDRLPWKGGTEANPDYECLRAELRKMAPVNGRAVLLFRSKCGCPVAKLIGWGPKKGRKHKKSLANSSANGDHR